MASALIVALAAGPAAAGEQGSKRVAVSKPGVASERIPETFWEALFFPPWGGITQRAAIDAPFIYATSGWQDVLVDGPLTSPHVGHGAAIPALAPFAYLWIPK
jgi:hypothetical protein